MDFLKMKATTTKEDIIMAVQKENGSNSHSVVNKKCIIITSSGLATISFATLRQPFLSWR
jgi:hypothetical protein